VLEGVACSVRHVLATAETDAGVRVAEVRTAGGGSRLALWTQIKADMTGRPFVNLPATEPGTLGAAILGMVAAGLAADLGSAAATMVQPGPLVTPDAGLAARYDDVYRTYLALYPRLHEVMHSISQYSDRLDE
jgi:sugar (pentulose or hexulose) kinase